MLRPISTAVAAVCCSAIVASDVDSLQQKMVYLDDVVITSFKRQSSLQQAPLSISSVSGTQLNQHQVVNVKELGGFIPNLFMPDYGSKLTSPVYIRGIGSKINSPSVGLYVDGVPYFEKSAFDFNFSDIERVEVLRGPQGTLYGRNAMGGIIEVYTRSPFDYQGTELRYSHGNYNQIDATVSHYNKVSDTFAFSVSGNYNHQDGFFVNRYTSESADPLDAAAGRVRLQWMPHENLQFGLVSSFDYSDQGGYPYAPYDLETGELEEVNYNEYSSYRRKISTTGLTVYYTHKRYAMQSKTAFQYLKDAQGVDQDFTAADVYFATQDQRQRMVTQELTFKSTEALGGHYQWLVGAFGFYQDVDSDVGVHLKTQEMLQMKYYDTPSYGAAIYHQSAIENLFVKGLTLTAGIRFDMERADATYREEMTMHGESKPVKDYDSDLKFHQFTPKFALQYTHQGAHTVYASVAKGYKTGGFNTSYETDADRTYLPEHSWNYEIGLKNDFLSGRLRTELSLFYIDWRNQQIYQPIPSATGSMLKNAGHSVSKGVELSIFANPFNGLTLQGSYGFTYAKFEDYQRTETTNYAGNYLPCVPKNTASTSVQYTWNRPMVGLDRVIFGAHYKINGPIYWNDSNTAKQDLYHILDARVALHTGPVMVALWAKNITNTRYNAYYFETGSQGYAQAGRPATFGATCSLTF